MAEEKIHRGKSEENVQKSPNLLTDKQERMKDVMERFTIYVDTYVDDCDYMNYSDECFIKDMMYGIGFSLEPTKYRFGLGFRKFMINCYESWLKRFMDQETAFKENKVLECTKND